MARATVRRSSFHTCSARLRPRLASAGAAALTLACAASSAAQAEGRDGARFDGLTLTWIAPDECPDRAQLLSRIRSHLPVDSRPEAAVAAEARVLRARGRYALTLRLSGGEGETAREAEAATCGVLADLTALLVALALDPAAAPPEARAAAETTPEPDAGAPASPPSSASSSSGAGGHDATADTPAGHKPRRVEAAPAPRATDASPAEDSERTDEPEPGAGVSFTSGEPSGFAVDLGIAFALDLGMLPQRPSPGGRVEAGVRFAKLRAGVGLALWPAFETRADGYPSARLRARGSIGELAIGLELARAPLRVTASALFEAGRLSVETRGIAQPDRGDTTWLGAGVRMHAAYRLWQGIELGIDLTVVAPFSRPSWFVHLAEGDVTVFSASPIALRGAAGISYVLD